MVLTSYLLYCFFLFACFLNNVDGTSLEQDLSLTLHQKVALDRFRERVSPLLTNNHMKNDIYLIRWLRARNFNVNAAESMLRQNLRWRKENRMDGILQEDWSDIKRDYPATIDTYDKQGRPIGVIDIYEWDIRRSIIQGIAPRLLRYTYYLLESITTQVFERQERGMNVTQWKVLGNAGDFNLIQHGCPACIPYWIQFVQCLENNYNGWLDEVIVIDAPTTISVVLEAIRPILSKPTRDSLRIFGPNRARWMPYLDERIDRSERRATYGGVKPPVKY